MKRFLPFVLILAMLISGCSSGIGESEMQQGTMAAQFYYVLSEQTMLSGEDVIQPETRSLVAYTLEELLNVYFKGPDDAELTSPYPYGTHVVGVGQDSSGNGTLLTLSGEFFDLTAVDFSIACCCLANTVCTYLGTDSIAVQDEFNRVQLTLYPDDYLVNYSDDAEADSLYTLYFAGDNNRFLIPETRNVTLSENESPAEYVLHELLQGPQGTDGHSPFPKGTMLLNVYENQNVCVVNFSAAFRDAAKDCYQAYMLVYSIVNTLTGLDGIDYVSILIEGQAVRSLGCIGISAPLARYSDVIGPVNSSSGQLDLSIYVLNPDETEAFGVPVSIKQTIFEPLAEAVAKAAVAFEPPGEMVNPIPYGTEVLSVEVSGAVCYLDVSSKIVPVNDTPEREKSILWSLVTTLTELDNIDSVLLTVEGESTSFQYVDISEPLTSDDVAFRTDS